MSKRQNNKIVCDLNKVQWAIFKYQNQYGNELYKLPDTTTVFGEAVDSEARALYHHDYPDENLLMRAIRLGLVDNWTPKLMLKFSANETLIYTGDKAKEIYKAWCAKIYGKQKRSKKS